VDAQFANRLGHFTVGSHIYGVVSTFESGQNVKSFLCLFIVSSLFVMGVPVIFGDRVDQEIGSLAGYRNIKFTQKPNVHLIPFDSMIPEVLSNKHMGLEQLGYSDYLEDEGAIIFKNMFSSQAPTSPSLNSIMRLANPDFSGSGYFAGRSESPVSYIFKNNGYKLASGFDTFRIFGKPGTYIDEYRTTYPGSPAHSAICRFNGTRSNIMRLFGFCYYTPLVLFEPKLDQGTWHEIILNTIEDKGKSNEPWLTFHYIFRPIGHTIGSYNHNSPADLDEYARNFLNQSNVIGDKILPKLV